MRVLVVDDDAAVRDSLRRSLAFEGYEVSTAADGAEALELLATPGTDVVVLDIQMPGVDGLEACRRLRARGDDVPVLMLTARDGTGDRVTGLDVGADDYLGKPFALEELFARLRALVRRRRAADASGRVLRHADLAMDTATREVTRGGVAIALTPTEYALLEMLLSHPRHVLTREQLLREVWGYEHETRSNTLDVYVGYLRAKTEVGGRPRLVQTVRGVGYALREAAP